MSEIMITIPQQTYFDLLEAQFLLSCLQEAGVDNWQGIEEAITIRGEREKNSTTHEARNE